LPALAMHAEHPAKNGSALIRSNRTVRMEAAR
jgi:hypothetical protein